MFIGEDLRAISTRQKLQIGAILKYYLTINFTCNLIDTLYNEYNDIQCAVQYIRYQYRTVDKYSNQKIRIRVGLKKFEIERFTASAYRVYLYFLKRGIFSI